MKNLYLVRHATPVSNASLLDKERPLTGFGILQCKKLATFLHQMSSVPDLIISSSALRTKQTTKNLCDSLGVNIKTIFTDKLYYASPSEIFETIKLNDDQYSNLMIISHNPSISEIAIMLANNKSSKAFFAFKRDFSPATIVKFQFAIDSWQNIEPAQGNILWMQQN